MNDLVFVVVLGILVVFSALQTMEIASLRETGVSVSAPGTVQQPTKSSDAGSFSLPSNLENLDTMVGGC